MAAERGRPSWAAVAVALAALAATILLIDWLASGASRTVLVVAAFLAYGLFLRRLDRLAATRRRTDPGA